MSNDYAQEMEAWRQEAQTKAGEILRLHAWISAMDENSKRIIDLCQSRVVELEAERDLWKERYEDERRDHEATIQHCNNELNEWASGVHDR